MANARALNVIRVDTNDTTLAYSLKVCGIKYIGNASGTATIKAESSAGETVFVESGANNVYNQVHIHSPRGLHIGLTNGAVIYLYVE